MRLFVRRTAKAFAGAGSALVFGWLARHGIDVSPGVKDILTLAAVPLITYGIVWWTKNAPKAPPE